MTVTKQSRVFLGLGANLGDPQRAFCAACLALAAHPQIRLAAASSLYRTPPCGGPAGQPDYLNAVIAIDTELPPGELLGICQQLEAAAGRTRTVHWGPRPLDIDILLYASLVCENPTLTLPHPGMSQRHFVLLPLNEIAAEVVHPTLGCSIAQLLAKLPEPEGITRVKENWLNDD